MLFFEQPLAAIQHSASRRQAWVCSHCLRFIGSVEQQLARVLLAAQDDDAASESSEEPQSEGSASEGCPASGVEDAALQALASGALRLPCSDAAPLPQPVRCRGRCSEDWYCSKACEAAAWDKCHQLLCTGAAEQENGQQRAAEAGSSGAARAKGKRPAADVVPGYARADAAADPAVARQRAEALMAFNDFADGTNDVFRLAAKVVAATLLAAERQLAADASSGVHGTSASASASANSAAADPERCWAALGHAWLPFAVGHKGLWWECTAAPPEAAEDMRALAEDALQLLVPALPAPLLSRYPALLSLEVWGSIIGMFEVRLGAGAQAARRGCRRHRSSCDAGALWEAVRVPAMAMRPRPGGMGPAERAGQARVRWPGASLQLQASDAPWPLAGRVGHGPAPASQGA